jgi:hypothetical protein
MKRCPQCEFIYEEGQRLCDMDGVELVHDPVELPRNGPSKQRKVAKSILQLFAIALPAMLLGSVLVYGSMAQNAQTTQPAEGIDASETTADVDASAPAEPPSQTLGDAPTAETTKPDEPSVQSAEADDSQGSANKSSSSEPSTPSDTSSAPPTAQRYPDNATDGNSTMKGPRLNDAGEAPSRTATSRDGKPIIEPSQPAARREARKPRPAAASQNSQPKNAHQSKSTKIGTFLKKTGRFLKKPFER